MSNASDSKGRAALKSFTGEVIGTSIMCFLGIGAVATATLFGAMTGPAQVGLVWGLAIALGIFVTRDLSDAHFNPAVTLAMCLSGRMAWRELPVYFAGQAVGAFLASGALWLLFADSVMKSLKNAGMTMASNSVGSAASIWCELFPNTTNGAVTALTGAFAEGFGVFLLVCVIFSLTDSSNIGRPNRSLAPLFIGLTVTVIICVVGPLTDAGLNPARDIMPRVWAALVGWAPVAFGGNPLETLLVYVVGPFAGAAVAALLYRLVYTPFYAKAAAPVPEPDVE